MRIGSPWWIGAGDPKEGIEQAAALGMDFLEISLDAPWPETLDGRVLREAADQAGIELGFHGPWRTQSLAHPREPLARAAREVAQDSIDLARTAGGAYIVFHVDARDFGGFPHEGAIQRGLEQAHASLRAMSAGAGEGLEVLVENTSSPLGTPDELARFLEPVPGIGFCYDPGHAALAEAAEVEGATSETTAWTKRLADRFALLHLMDWVKTERGIVDHLVPGAGQAPLEEILDAVEQTGCDRVLLEAFFSGTDRAEATPEDLAQARERVQALLQQV